MICCPVERVGHHRMQGEAKCIGVALRLFKMELRKLSVVYRFSPFCHPFFFDSTSSSFESLQKKRSVASVATSLGTFPWGKLDFLVIEKCFLCFWNLFVEVYSPPHFVCHLFVLQVLEFLFQIFTFSFFVFIVTVSLKLLLSYLICHVIVG